MAVLSSQGVPISQVVLRTGLSVCYFLRRDVSAPFILIVSTATTRIESISTCDSQSRLSKSVSADQKSLCHIRRSQPYQLLMLS